MSKYIFVCIFIIPFLLCLYCFIKSFFIKHRIRLALLHLTAASTYMCLSYVLTFLLDSYKGSLIAYSVYYFCVDWLCISIFLFILAFTGRERKLKIFETILIPVGILQSASMLSNIFLKHSFELIKDLSCSYEHYIVEEKGPFYIHLTICYIIIGITILLLIYEVCHTYGRNKSQYAIILSIIAMTTMINAIFGFNQVNINLSVFCHGIAVALIFYYITFLIPLQLRKQVSDIVLDDLNIAVILFDKSGNILYENAETANWKYQKGYNKKTICRLLGLPEDESILEYQKEIVYKENDDEVILDVHYATLNDSDKHKQDIMSGSYFLMRDITKQRKRLIEREFYANHDELTGLYNKKYFLERAAALVNQYKDELFCIVVVDLDKFWLYSNIFGKRKGDELLRNLANNFVHFIDDDKILYARYEGNSYVLCMPASECEEEKLINSKLFDPIYVDSFKLRNDVGICEITNLEIPIEKYCEYAIIAMNTIKNNDISNVAYYNDTIREGVLYDMKLATSYLDALDGGEIVLYIQKQVNAVTNEIVGGEVLARWIKSDGEIIPPSKFIPILETHGLIHKHDMYIWEHTCMLIKELCNLGYPVPLSVNLSAQDCYRFNVYEVFTGLVKKYEIEPKYLRIEITESGIIQNLEDQLNLIKSLQKEGFMIEMDDFGSGYSSLNTLKDIPVDVIKMDMRFFQSYETNEKSSIIIKNIINMASDLDVVLIAEGVEQKNQADFLISNGCRYIQGYLYGKPVSTELFIKDRINSIYSEMN